MQYAIANSRNNGGKTPILDNIMPNLLPLALTILVYWLLHKKVSPLICMISLMIFGIAGYALGILGI